MPWTKPYTPARNKRLAPEAYTYSHFVYFITIHSFRDCRPFQQNGLNDMVLASLKEEAERRNCRVFTYCLMPNHLHFLASPRQDGISILSFADQYKGKTTNRSWKFGWQGKLWQPRYYDHIVQEGEDLVEIAKYILDNPVRKGYVSRWQDWPWCGHFDSLPVDIV